MGWLIDKIRAWFCKHEWECLMSEVPIYIYSNSYPEYYEWLYVCKKCKKRKKIIS